MALINAGGLEKLGYCAKSSLPHWELESLSISQLLTLQILSLAHSLYSLPLKLHLEAYDLIAFHILKQSFIFDTSAPLCWILGIFFQVSSRLLILSSAVINLTFHTFTEVFNLNDDTFLFWEFLFFQLCFWQSNFLLCFNSTFYLFF